MMVDVLKEEKLKNKKLWNNLQKVQENKNDKIYIHADILVSILFQRSISNLTLFGCNINFLQNSNQNCFTARRLAENKTKDHHAEEEQYQLLLEQKRKLEQVLMQEESRCHQLDYENKELHNEIYMLNKKKMDMTKEFKYKVDTKTGIQTKILRYKNIRSEFGQRIDKAKMA